MKRKPTTETRLGAAQIATLRRSRRLAPRHRVQAQCVVLHQPHHNPRARRRRADQQRAERPEQASQRRLLGGADDGDIVCVSGLGTAPGVPAVLAGVAAFGAIDP